MTEAEARLQAAIARLERAASALRARGGDGGVGEAEVAMLRAESERLREALAAAERARATLSEANAQAVHRVEAAIARLSQGLGE